MILKLGQTVVDISLYLRNVLIAFPQHAIKFRRRRHLQWHELYVALVESFPVVALCIGFISCLLIFELTFHMKLVLSNGSLVPSFSTVLLMRELGPIIVALLLTSRVGAAQAAELANMKAMEQLDMLAVLNISAIEFWIVPRVIAGVVSCVLVSICSIALGLFVCMVLAPWLIAQSPSEFALTMFFRSSSRDLWDGILKSAVFGCIYPLVSGYHGLKCGSSSESVGEAATHAVVQSAVLIIFFDFAITATLFWLS